MCPVYSQSNEVDTDRGGQSLLLRSYQREPPTSCSPTAEEPLTGSWDPEQDVAEYPTDAHGEIIFINEGESNSEPAKATDVQHVLQLFTSYWELQRPKLVISVRGGQKQFRLNTKDQETFNRGLIKAAQSVGAWIITGLHHLIKYKVTKDVARNRPVSLNPNHTHFLLIDDGLHDKYGADTGFRPLVESAINKPQEECGLGVPVVLLALEGGIDVIVAAKNAIQHRIPIVICEGTGRAADIIAFAHKHAKNIGLHLNILTDRISHAFGSHGYVKNSKKMEDVITMVAACIQEEKLVTVFDMTGDSDDDLDHAILLALLKAEATSPLEQMSLALSWQRADIAKSKILNDTVAWEWSSLYSCITTACIKNQVDFLSLFLEHGVIMKEYLTVATLRGLYNHASRNSFLRTFSGRLSDRKPNDRIYLSDIARIVHALIGAHDVQLYKYDRRLKACITLIMTSSCTGIVHSAQEEYLQTDDSQFGLLTTTGPNALTIAKLANPGMHFDQPFRELFIWAVLNEKLEMAEFFWKESEDAVSSAVAASAMLTQMARLYKHHDNEAQFEEGARKFEQLAIDVMEECHNTNEDLAQMLVDRPYSCWGGKNSITMAAETGNQYRSDYGSFSTRKQKRNWWLKFYYFYTAPVTKFWMNAALFAGDLESVSHKAKRWASSEWNSVKEMFLFLSILLVIMLGFGVSCQALMNPNQEFNLTALKNTLFMPYFQIYGELFLDVFVPGETGSCSSTTGSCPSTHFLLPILLSFYLLFTNILLLNLLIAIFSHVFDEVQENSLAVWRYELYWLVMEFHHRPTLPLPFMILEHIFTLLKVLYRKGIQRCCRTKKEGYVYKYSKQEMSDLRVFEKECSAKYRMMKNKQAKEETTERLERLEERLDRIGVHLEQMKDAWNHPEPGMQGSSSVPGSWDSIHKISSKGDERRQDDIYRTKDSLNGVGENKESLAPLDTAQSLVRISADGGSVNKVLDHQVSFYAADDYLKMLSHERDQRGRTQAGLRKRKKHKRRSKNQNQIGENGDVRGVSKADEGHREADSVDHREADSVDHREADSVDHREADSVDHREADSVDRISKEQVDLMNSINNLTRSGNIHVGEKVIDEASRE
nr:transient receptor potential cation channel subfamily M member 1-2 [Apostichopus japonicus]